MKDIIFTFYVCTCNLQYEPSTVNIQNSNAMPIFNLFYFQCILLDNMRTEFEQSIMLENKEFEENEHIILFIFMKFFHPSSSKT